MKDTKPWSTQIELGDPLDGCQTDATHLLQPPPPTREPEQPVFPREWIKKFLCSGALRAMSESGASRGAGKKRNPTWSEAVVYLILIAHMDENRQVDLSQPGIMRLSGLGSATSVSKATKTLDAIGVIREHHGGLGQGKSYEILDLPDLPLPPQPKKGKKSSTLRQSRPQTYISSDGHIHRSWLEALMDTLLDALKIPHVPEVTYAALVEGWEGKHRVDFALAPRLVIEVWSPDIPGYTETRKLKETRCSQLGITLLGVENARQALEIMLQARKLLGDTWAGATLDQLKGFQRAAKASGHCLSASYTARALDERIAHVQVNPLERPKPPLDGGVYRGDGRAIRKVDAVPEGNRINACEPQICEVLDMAWSRMNTATMEIAGLRVAQEQRCDRENLTALQAKIQVARDALDRADAHFSMAETKITERLKPVPGSALAQAQAERARAAEAREDNRVKVAQRLLKRLEAAMQGQGDPYTKVDERKALEARKAKIRELVREGFPELGEGEVVNEEDAERYIEEALADAGAERLEDIL